ncbi:MAG: hypothetical protein WAX69_22435, partial [Victivallales bacterium]
YLVYNSYITGTDTLHCAAVDKHSNWMFHTFGFRERAGFLNILRVKEGSKYFLLADSSRDFMLNYEAPSIQANYTAWEHHYACMRHLKRANFSFLDGHAEGVSSSEAVDYGINYCIIGSP